MANIYAFGLYEGHKAKKGQNIFLPEDQLSNLQQK